MAPRETGQAFDRGATRAAYDTVAADYAERIAGELADKPLDRALLDEVAAVVAGRGRVLDVGCGPGHVARYLRDRGANVVGVDLSPRMLAEARRLSPDIEFVEGDMLALDWPAGAFVGIVAAYSLIHIPPELVPAAFREFRRVLVPGGLLVVAVHEGRGLWHRDEWWGYELSLDATYFEADELERAGEAAGFSPVSVLERPPNPEVEHETRRLYSIATAV